MSDKLTIEQRHANFRANRKLKNMDSYAEVQKKLAEMRWHSIVVWECELKQKVKDKTLERLAFTLNHIFLQDHLIRRRELPEERHQIRRYELPDEDAPMMAAEDVL